MRLWKHLGLHLQQCLPKDAKAEALPVADHIRKARAGLESHKSLKPSNQACSVMFPEQQGHDTDLYAEPKCSDGERKSKARDLLCSTIRPICNIPVSRGSGCYLAIIHAKRKPGTTEALRFRMSAMQCHLRAGYLARPGSQSPQGPAY